jgi:hypothetical protein
MRDYQYYRDWGTTNFHDEEEEELSVKQGKGSRYYSNDDAYEKHWLMIVKLLKEAKKAKV